MTQNERLSQAVEMLKKGDQTQLLEQLQQIAQAQAVIPEYPVLAPNVELVGKMQDSGFSEQQWLIQRNGQFIQVSELLYKVTELCNGERNQEQIAAAMTESTQWTVTADHVRLLIKKLIPLGLVVSEGGVVTTPQQNPSALRVNMRSKMIGPHIINPVADALKFLYTPVILIPVLLTALLIHGWLYLQHGEGLVRGFLSALYQPWQFFVVLGLMILGGIFHELGHAAALRYGGGHVRGAGVGLYLIYPVLYTDTTDSYRLGRWGRVRTDLGGFYFYLIFASLMVGAYLITGQAFLLLTVVIISLDILYQLLPFVRFDGYWTLADLTGIPDLLSQIKPFVASLLPNRAAGENKLPPLKPWVKRVFIGYILLTIPVLALLFLFMLWRLPRFVSVMWASYTHHFRTLAAALGNGDYLGSAAYIIQMLLLALPLLGVFYIIYAFSWPAIKGLWRWSQPTVARRVSGAMVAIGVVAFLVYLWTPTLSALNNRAPAGVERIEVTSREHVEGPIAYEHMPPAGGDHAPVWQNCGFYDRPIPDENAVHSLEHGAVWITYQPSVGNDEIRMLRQLASQSYILVSPYPAQSHPVIATAWGHQLRLDSAGDDRLEQFINAFRLARTAPERGESCSGGVGEPQ
jgi:putative peptide zinc metalloprotease protein